MGRVALFCAVALWTFARFADGARCARLRLDAAGCARAGCVAGPTSCVEPGGASRVVASVCESLLKSRSRRRKSRSNAHSFGAMRAERVPVRNGDLRACRKGEILPHARPVHSSGAAHRGATRPFVVPRRAVPPSRTDSELASLASRLGVVCRRSDARRNERAERDRRRRCTRVRQLRPRLGLCARAGARIGVALRGGARLDRTLRTRRRARYVPSVREVFAAAPRRGFARRQRHLDAGARARMFGGAREESTPVPRVVPPRRRNRMRSVITRDAGSSIRDTPVQEFVRYRIRNTRFKNLRDAEFAIRRLKISRDTGFGIRNTPVSDSARRRLKNTQGAGFGFRKTLVEESAKRRFRNPQNAG